ncbi:4'-phosphopantetheinyl transferase family protein [Sphaerisporangium dianthi]|uniref:4'-phosphopantetheinyl transferase family protein n=1 Tax=Sphaerisporangium dianthi TaxID=1436120 RepID=A0ABV9CRL4_9ACTN
MSAAEAERLRGTRRRSDRDRFTVGAALIRLVVAGYLGGSPRAVEVDRSCDRCGLQHGRPRLPAAPELRTSLSHSGERVVLAVARHAEVGVDVEILTMSKDPGTLARRILSEAELDDWTRLPHHDRRPALKTYWTRKEALVKATGEGLRTPLSAITVSPPSAPAALIAWPGHPGVVGRTGMRALRGGEGYVAHLAVVGLPRPEVVERDAGPLLARGGWTP